MIIPDGQFISFDEKQFTDDFGNTHCQLLYGIQNRYFQVQKEYIEIGSYVEYDITATITSPGTYPVGYYWEQVIGTIPGGDWFISLESYTISNTEMDRCKMEMNIYPKFDLLNNTMDDYIHTSGGVKNIRISHTSLVDFDITLKFRIYDRANALSQNYYKIQFDSIGAVEMNVLGVTFETQTDAIEYTGYVDESEVSPSESPMQTVVSGELRKFRIYLEETINASTTVNLRGTGLPIAPTQENATHLLYEVHYTPLITIDSFQVILTNGSQVLTSNVFSFCYTSIEPAVVPLNPACSNISLIEIDNKEMCIGDYSLYPFEYTNEIYLKTSILDQFRKDQKIDALETYKLFQNNYFATTKKAVSISIFKPHLVNLEPYIIDALSMLLGRFVTIDSVVYQVNEQDYLEKEKGRFVPVILELDIYGKQTIFK